MAATRSAISLVSRPAARPARRGAGGPSRTATGAVVAAMQLVGAIRRDHHDAFAPEATCDEGEQVAGRAVGPMQVLGDEDHRSPLSQAFEQRQERTEQSRRRPLRGHVGHHRRLRRPSSSGTSRPSSRVVGSITSSRDARSSDRRHRGVPRRSERTATLRPNQGSRNPLRGPCPRVARLARQLGKEPALPDPGLAADKDHDRRAVLGAIERLPEGRHLSAAADQDRTR